MTAKYFAILTNQGAARLANAAALGTRLNLTQMAVGDANGTLPTPDPAQTKLINQKRIAPLNLLTVDPANTRQIIAEQIIPENEGGFWIREIGLYDDDGILIAVANCPETYKPQLQEGSGRTQTIRMILIVSSTSAITLKIDPSVVLATRKYVDDKVIEVKAYSDDLMEKHVNADNPHTQYPLIANALKEMADAGLVAEVLKNLGLTALGIGGQGTKLPALDWQTFDFVPGAIYYVSSTDITNMPAGIFTPSSKATLVLNVSGYDGITRHIDMWWATGTTDYRKYQVVVVGFSGNKTFTVRQIFTSSGIVPVEYGGTGASTVDDVLRNWGVAKALEEKQPKDVTLTALAALVGAANKIPYFNGDDTAALTDLSQVGRDIIGKRDIAELIQYLGISDLKVLDSTDNKWLWKLPNGVIFQVFKTDVQNTSTIGVSLDNMVTFPVAFPSECFAVLICKATYVQIIASAEIPTRTQCKIVTIPVTTPIATWTTTTILAIGR
ncbi:phage tail protein [Citrobacter freundii]|uniref:phage tail protein n=1 Tax=Citrobacter freundii TaxID=546 RepID=UPI0023B2E539|nr:phage tail protein [Citrobacter freundii]MDE9594161.1 phage tail protein [Citrobacter freundii]MDV1711868.1 phage tail protein [Citrobacter freundii]MDV2013384.1 phage tail protein [Citrobacter freundii]MEB0314438.1 phage tail protein [Citrobacter freundii]MEB0381220.1 phage tail protein [Citrobacter freundii]